MDAGIVLGVLPVEWGSLDAVNRGNNNLIFWTTFTEINNETFKVQRSADGIGSFTTIGEVRPDERNSYALKSYNYVDNDINWSQYFYRIVQVDVNGKESISEIVQLEINKDGFLLYPNPIDRELKNSSGSFKDMDAVTIKIYD